MSTAHQDPACQALERKHGTSRSNGRCGICHTAVQQQPVRARRPGWAVDSIDGGRWLASCISHRASRITIAVLCVVLSFEVWLFGRTQKAPRGYKEDTKLDQTCTKLEDQQGLDRRSIGRWLDGFLPCIAGRVQLQAIAGHHRPPQATTGPIYGRYDGIVTGSRGGGVQGGPPAGAAGSLEHSDWHGA